MKAVMRYRLFRVMEAVEIGFDSDQLQQARIATNQKIDPERSSKDANVLYRNRALTHPQMRSSAVFLAGFRSGRNSLYLSFMRKLAVLLFCAPLVASQDVIQRADELYGRTQYEESLRVLISGPALDAAGYALAGKNYYMLGNYKKATESFEKAASLAPSNPEYALWLGRTYGRKAEAGSWLLAPVNASRARQYFEKAVALSPHYHEALNDLFAFYLQAPGFVGGGVDKAEAIAKRVAEESPAEYSYDQAQLAEKKKDYAAEESHLRRAVELAPREVGRVIDLARFLARRGRAAETEQAFAQAEMLAPADPRIDFERAKIYVEHRRDLEEARRLLRQYLAAEVTPDYPAKQTAEILLRKAMEN